jgi:Sec-independent protein translocase protein TatA
MLGISWYEFLVVLLISFVFLRPSDFRKIIVAIRDFVNFVNSLIRDITTTVEKSIAFDDLKIEDFYTANKDPKIKDTENIEPFKSVSDYHKKFSVDKNNEN